MYAILLIVMIAGVPTPFTFSDPSVACQVALTQYPKQQYALYKFDLSYTDSVAVPLVCLPPVSVPDKIVIVPATTQYPVGTP